MFRLFALTFGLLSLISVGQAKMILSADILYVHDGDTFRAIFHPWPGQTNNTLVRVRGIDTPELHGKCSQEKSLAAKAASRATELLSKGALVEDLAFDKYGGRMVGTVFLMDGRNLADVLIAEKLAHPYNGGKKQGWCN